MLDNFNVKKAFFYAKIAILIIVFIISVFVYVLLHTAVEHENTVILYKEGVESYYILTDQEYNYIINDHLIFFRGNETEDAVLTDIIETEMIINGKSIYKYILDFNGTEFKNGSVIKFIEKYDSLIMLIMKDNSKKEK